MFSFPGSTANQRRKSHYILKEHRDVGARKSKFKFQHELPATM
jgi:hypothetical protein